MSSSWLIELPFDPRSFCSVESDTPPNDHFLAYVAREVRLAALCFSDVEVSRLTYGQLREATKIWLRQRRRAGELEEQTAPGVTAPRISNRVPNGCGLVGAAR
jgi:hypothetical protein